MVKSDMQAHRYSHTRTRLSGPTSTSFAQNVATYLDVEMKIIFDFELHEQNWVFRLPFGQIPYGELSVPQHAGSEFIIPVMRDTSY